MKFPTDRIPLYPIVNFWAFGQIMAIGQCKALSLKIVILEFFYHHYEISNDKVPLCPILEIWDFGRIRAYGDYEL
jgi:hypothetical protein